jgi:hypothetical protein
MKLDPLDILFSRYIKLLAGGICEYCGQRPNSRGYHTHHFIGRRYLNTRYEQDNCVALCMSCHNLMGDFPDESQAFFVKRVGSQRAEELKIIARTYHKMTPERREKIKEELNNKIKQWEVNNG